MEIKQLEVIKLDELNALMTVEYTSGQVETLYVHHIEYVNKERTLYFVGNTYTHNPYLIIADSGNYEVIDPSLLRELSEEDLHNDFIADSIYQTLLCYKDVVAGYDLLITSEEYKSYGESHFLIEGELPLLFVVKEEHLAVIDEVNREQAELLSRKPLMKELFKSITIK